MRSRWLRFQVARLSSLLLSVAAFPLLAPVIGTSPAYWSLLAAGAVVNFCSDRYWSFRHEPRPTAATATGLPRPADPRRIVLGSRHRGRGRRRAGRRRNWTSSWS